MKISGKFEPTTGVSKKRPRKKLAKCELYDITRNTEEWIANIELFKGYLRKMDVKIDD